jgi:hypothetical protein
VLALIEAERRISFPANTKLIFFVLFQFGNEILRSASIKASTHYTTEVIYLNCGYFGCSFILVYFSASRESATIKRARKIQASTNH